MIETQQSICAWADATFGPPASDADLAAWALREMSELVTACVIGEPAERIGVEIADVVIVLARLGRSLDVDVFEAGRALTTRLDVAQYAANAARNIASLIGDGDFTNLRWALGALALLAVSVGVDLPAAIDAKMAINRARKWTLDGRGHGQHTEEA